MLSKHCFLSAALGGIVVLGNSSLAAAQTVGPNGEAATPSSALTLTDAEVAKLKEGKYSAALVWHTSSDFISAVTAGAIHEFDRAGIKVVATTDAGFDSAQQLSDVETVMAKSPSVILALPLDPIGSAKAFQAAKEKGVELVFLSNVPAGYKQGVDYVSIVTDDLSQMGKQAADALAKSLLNKGKVAWIFHDAQYYVTNQRDNAFRKTIENDYKNMPIVASINIRKAIEKKTMLNILSGPNPGSQLRYVSLGSRLNRFRNTLRQSRNNPSDTSGARRAPQAESRPILLK